jgi:ferrous iron transport protein B
MTNQNINVALIGNPNTGKTSVLINWQDWISKWGIIRNYGWKKIGLQITHNAKANILDLPEHTA